MPTVPLPPPPQLLVRCWNNHYPFSLEALKDLQAALQQYSGGGGGRAAPVRIDMVRSGSAPATETTESASGAPLPQGVGGGRVKKEAGVIGTRRSYPGYDSPARQQSKSVHTPHLTAKPTIDPNCPTLLPSALPAGLSPTAIRSHPFGPNTGGHATAAGGSGGHQGPSLTPAANCVAGPSTQQGSGHKRNSSNMTDSSDPDCGCGVCFSAPNNLTVQNCGHKLCIQVIW